MQYTWDGYRSICSAIKCTLEITADDYFVTSNGAVYNAIQAAYIVLWIVSFYILTFTASLYDGIICLFSYERGEIIKQNHS